MEPINKRLKQIREELGISQTDFANRIGMKQPYLSALEAGKNEVTAKIISLLVEHFQVSADWLITGKSKKFISYSNEENFNKLPASGKKPHVDEKLPKKLDLIEEQEEPKKIVNRSTWQDKTGDDDDKKHTLLANPSVKDIIAYSKDKDKRHLLKQYLLTIKDPNSYLEHYWERRLKKDLTKEREDLSILEDNIAFFSVYQYFMKQIDDIHFQCLTNLSVYTLPLLIKEKADYKDFKELYFSCLEGLKEFAPMLERLVPALKESVKEAMKIDPNTNDFFRDEELE